MKYSDKVLCLRSNRKEFIIGEIYEIDSDYTGGEYFSIKKFTYTFKGKKLAFQLININYEIF